MWKVLEGPEGSWRVQEGSGGYGGLIWAGMVLEGLGGSESVWEGPGGSGGLGGSRRVLEGPEGLEESRRVL